MKIEIKPKELIITKSYLKTLISKPITLKEIHNQVIIKKIVSPSLVLKIYLN